MRAIRELRAESSAVEADGGRGRRGETPNSARQTRMRSRSRSAGAWPPSDAWLEPDEETGEDIIRLSDGRGEAKVPLETLNVLGFGVSHKRLEQAIRELQLPVVLVREADDADVVITLRNYYKQKAPALREAEERGLPIFVLKSNTIVQMEACLTSLFALDVDPNEAALREVEEAIGLVRQEQKPVELSPQNAYIRRLQHQAAERANFVSRSRGREPYRRVRVYPDRVRAWRCPLTRVAGEDEALIRVRLGGARSRETARPAHSRSRPRDVRTSAGALSSSLRRSNRHGRNRPQSQVRAGSAVDMGNLLAARHWQRSRRSKLCLAIRQLPIEVIELGPSPGDFATTLLDLDDQLRLHVVAPAIHTEAGETTRLRELDAQPAQGHDHAQAARSPSE